MNIWKKIRVHNAGNPKGFFGRQTLWKMNEEHSELTNLGFSFLDIPLDATCLDIGCGGGRTVHKLARFAPNGKVYGVDISDTSVKATKRFNRKDIKKGLVEVMSANVLKLPFERDTFDVVTAVETFYFWQDKEGAVKSVYDVMKKGGTFIIMLDAYEDGTEDAKDIVEEINLELNTPEQLKNWLTNAGFSARVITKGKRIFAIGTK